MVGREQGGDWSFLGFARLGNEQNLWNAGRLGGLSTCLLFVGIHNGAVRLTPAGIEELQRGFKH